MSHRWQKKVNKKKERKTNKQRPRVPSSNLGSSIYYQPLSERGCTFALRQSPNSTADEWILESNNAESISPTFQGRPTLRKITRTTEVDT